MVSDTERKQRAEEIKAKLKEKMREMDELKERLRELGETPMSAEKNLRLLEEIKVPSLATIKEKSKA